MGKFAAGFLAAIICAILAALALSAVARNRPHLQFVIALDDMAGEILKLIFGPKTIVPPTPDLPVVVRGGSLNIFTNRGVTWTQVVGSTTLYSADTGNLANDVALSGFYEHGNTESDYSEYQLTNNWTATLTYRPGPTSSGGSISICSSKSTVNGTEVCNPSPRGSLKGNLVYLDTSKLNAVFAPPAPGSSGGYDERNGSRVHVKLNRGICKLVDANGDDADSECAKVTRRNS